MADWIEYAKLIGGGAGAAGIATLAKLYHDRVVAGKNNELVLKDAELGRIRDELAKAGQRAAEWDGASPVHRDLGRLREQLTETVERLARQLGAQAASLYVPIASTRDDVADFPRGFAFVAAYNTDPGATTAVLRMKLVESWTIVGECWAKNAVIGDNQLQANARHVTSYDKQSGFVPVHTLVAPVHWENRPIGVVQVFNKTRAGNDFDIDPEGFDSQDRRALQEFLKDGSGGGVAGRINHFRSDHDCLRFLGLQGEVNLENAAIMCIDLTRSSSLFNELPLVDAARLINRFNENVYQRVAPYSAVVEKFSGDGTLLRFHYGGFDTETPANNPVFRAVCAAADLMHDFREFKGRQWKTLASDAADSVKLRVTIALGPVISTNVGPRQFQVPTVIGQCVNRAAKMIAYAPRDRDIVLVDDNARKALLQVRREYAAATSEFAAWPDGAARDAVSLAGHEYFTIATDAFRADAVELRQGRQWRVA